MTTLATWWSNFERWLDSGQGRLFLAMLFLIATFVAFGLLIYLMSRRSRRERELHSESSEAGFDAAWRPARSDDTRDKRG